MKKIIFSLLCIMMLCTAVTFAAETETVGGKITLTQFLGVSREDAKSVAITITMYDTDSETAYVGKDTFYDLSDNFMLTSTFEPEPLTWDGIYITVEKTDGNFSYAYIEQWGFADKYSYLTDRVPYSLYKVDDYLKTNELIALGKPDATQDEIVAAAKACHADGFIRRLPDGYDTVITDGGGLLSQGQRQLLCIARVMLALPPMLILDEATSSIDTRTELKIQHAFSQMMKGRTSFIVAHRLSTIREADVILVMKDGHVIEQGRHEQLLAQNGFYARLYNSQFEQ